SFQTKLRAWQREVSGIPDQDFALRNHNAVPTPATEGAARGLSVDSTSRTAEPKSVNTEATAESLAETSGSRIRVAATETNELPVGSRQREVVAPSLVSKDGTMASDVSQMSDAGMTHAAN